jgi:glutathione S-transferase
MAWRGAVGDADRVIRVHRIPFSTNVERVALAAGHKGIEIEWVDHDPADRSAVVALSGQRLVPIAEIAGAVVRGSMRIVDRLEELRPEPPLLSADPVDRARARIFVSWFDRVWKGPPNALDADAEPPDADALRSRCREWTSWCDDLLGNSPFLGGDALGVADICAFPFLKFAVVDPAPGDEERFHGILVDLLRSDSHPKLDEWVRRVDALPRA